MGKLIDPNKVYRFRLSSDGDNPEAMVFHIKPLTYRDSLDIMDGIKFGRDMKISTNESESRQMAFLSHIPKIENVCWPGSTAKADIESEEDRKRLFLMLSLDDGRELWTAIQNQSILEEHEIKN